MGAGGDEAGGGAMSKRGLNVGVAEVRAGRVERAALGVRAARVARTALPSARAAASVGAGGGSSAVMLVRARAGAGHGVVAMFANQAFRVASARAELVAAAVPEHAGGWMFARAVGVLDRPSWATLGVVMSDGGSAGMPG